MNAIVICIDTLRWDYLGCYGANATIRTPNIDKYAARATRFDAAFCGSFPTVPIRVDAYTGDVNWPRFGWKGLDPDQRAFPQILRENGYSTGLVLDTKNNIGAGLHQFYDEYHLIEKPPTNAVKPADIEVPFPPENTRQNSSGYRAHHANWAHYQHEADWFVARTMLRACEWLEDHHQDEKFFLWVDTFEPHELWKSPSYYVDMYSSGCQGHDYAFPNYGYTDIYKDDELERLVAQYSAEVTLTDTWTGHLLQHIDHLGLWEDTLVILLGDHGMYIGDHGRCGKHTVDFDDPWPLYDTVARVPFLVWSPFEQAPPSTEAMVQFADLHPTILDFCGIEPKAPRGQSWVRVLEGQTTHHWDEIYTSFFSWDGPGKIDYLRSLITVNNYDWSLVVGPPPHCPELYDRRNDPGQLENLASEHPVVVEELRKDLASFMSRQGAAPGYVKTFALGEA